MRRWRLGKVIVLAVVVAFCALAHPTLAAAKIKTEYPRLMNYYLAWTINETEARELSQWDMLVLDMEVARHNPASIRMIRELNPDVVILAYVTPAEMRTDLANLGNAAPMRTALAATIADAWYVKNAAGEPRSFWPKTTILNVSDSAPIVNGKQWNDVMVDFVKNNIMASGLWDGIFYDNAWEQITYFAGGSVDLDGDGANESHAKADELWRVGLRSLYKKTRDALPGYYVFANDGPLFAASVDGMLIENFIKDRWSIMVRKLQTVRDQSRTRTAILNANTENSGNATDYRAMRYGLATAFAHDSFYSFDSGDQTHAERWWYDEYKAFLGAPRGKAVTLANGLVRRDFDQGIVLVNPTAKVQRFTVVEEFEKLIGVQDPGTNDGSITSSTMIPSMDGLILLRRIAEVVGVPYQNGSYARVFTRDGTVSRAGFFAFNKRFADGVTTAVADLEGDGVLERITARGAVVTINNIEVHPFGKQFAGTLTFSFGDTNGNGRKEVVVAAASGGTGEVRIYDSQGRLSTLPFLAFGNKYRGGVSVAVGDVDGKGKAEVIVGAGPGGGPEVRIFNGEGKLQAPGFFAFDPRFRGGVYVAAGSFVAGRPANIIVGAGIGGGPQVRMFNGQGKTIGGGFFAFDRTRRTGVVPAVADIDGDGSVEILAFTRDFNAP